MKPLNLFLAVITYVFIFTSCLKEEENDKVKIVEVTIYPETGYGASVLSDVWTQPLIFSDNDDNQRRILIDIIFDDLSLNYERGYKYTLKAKKVWMREPPQDVSSIKYIYLELLSKEKVIIEDSEENIDLFVSSKTVKFTPKYPNEYEGDESTPKIYQALLVKKVDSDNWMAIIEINEFNFEEGFEYILSVKKVTQAEPYTIRYYLLDIKSKVLKD